MTTTRISEQNLTVDDIKLTILTMGAQKLFERGSSPFTLADVVRAGDSEITYREFFAECSDTARFARMCDEAVQALMDEIAS